MKINIKKILPKLLIRLLIIIVLVIFCIWQNNDIVITKSDYVNSQIPPAFNGFKIAHISDLHNKMFGENQAPLLAKLKNINPDIIVITGDLIDSQRYDLETAMSFISGAIPIAPVYFVSGNHEAYLSNYSTMEQRLVATGVKIMDNSQATLTVGLDMELSKNSIGIAGLKDPAFFSDLSVQLNKFSDTEPFNILLSHRPELFHLYSQSHMDLIFSGHAHGGQVRLPFIGGLVAPDQGFFPKYTSGAHAQNGATMFVSRGLGNSIIPVRVFNRPEIVVVTLRNKPIK